MRWWAASSSRSCARRAACSPSQPEVEERLRSLVGEIYHDEILHVAWLRARLHPWAIRIARRIAPLVAGRVMREVPQFHALGCSRREFVFRLRRGLEIPPELDWLDPEFSRA